MFLGFGGRRPITDFLKVLSVLSGVVIRCVQYVSVVGATVMGLLFVSLSLLGTILRMLLCIRRVAGVHLFHPRLHQFNIVLQVSAFFVLCLLPLHIVHIVALRVNILLLLLFFVFDRFACCGSSLQCQFPLVRSIVRGTRALCLCSEAVSHDVSGDAVDFCRCPSNNFDDYPVSSWYVSLQFGCFHSDHVVLQFCPSPWFWSRPL
jgi:hypothetical protein